MLLPFLKGSIIFLFFRVKYMNVHHIIPKAKMTSKKMVHKDRNLFLAQFFMPFVVWTIWFRVQKSLQNSEYRASDWLVKNFNQSRGGFLS